MEDALIFLGIFTITLLIYYAWLVVALAWIHYPEGIIKTAIRRRREMKKSYMIVITAKGDVAMIEQKGEPELETLHKLVGGYIEVVGTGLADDIKMIIDEEGKFKDYPVNRLASDMATLFPGDYIAGDAVLLRRSGENLLPIDEARARRIGIILGITKTAKGGKS